MSSGKMQKADAAIAQRIAQLWEQNRPIFAERLLELERVAASWPQVSEATRADAAGVAHKLAGSLGMFGLPEGTRLARLIEQALSDPANLDAAPLRAWVRDLKTVVNSGRG